MKITILEKSHSVGGRVATRRFGEHFVNHGTQNFNGLTRVLREDSIASELIGQNFFSGQATELPKRLRDRLLSQYSERVQFRFGWEARAILPSSLKSVSGEELNFHTLIVTAPVPQFEKMLPVRVSGVHYQKCLLFIGVWDSTPVRFEMDPEWSEEWFEGTDTEITLRAEEHLGHTLSGLSLKKWRYSRIKKGLRTSFYIVSDKIFLAGDAFDVQGEYDLGASWISGLSVSHHLLKG